MTQSKLVSDTLAAIMNKYKGTESVRKDIRKSKKKEEMAHKMRMSKEPYVDPMIDNPNGKHKRMPRYW